MRSSVQTSSASTMPLLLVQFSVMERPLLAGISPSLELASNLRLNFKTLRFHPAAPLERRKRFVDGVEWLVGLEGVGDARVHRRRNLFLAHDVAGIPISSGSCTQ